MVRASGNFVQLSNELTLASDIKYLEHARLLRSHKWCGGRKSLGHSAELIICHVSQVVIIFTQNYESRKEEMPWRFVSPNHIQQLYFFFAESNRSGLKEKPSTQGYCRNCKKSNLKSCSRIEKSLCTG